MYVDSIWTCCPTTLWILVENQSVLQEAQGWRKPEQMLLTRSTPKWKPSLRKSWRPFGLHPQQMLNPSGDWRGLQAKRLRIARKLACSTRHQTLRNCVPNAVCSKRPSGSQVSTVQRPACQSRSTRMHSWMDSRNFRRFSGCGWVTACKIITCIWGTRRTETAWHMICIHNVFVTSIFLAPTWLNQGVYPNLLTSSVYTICIAGLVQVVKLRLYLVWSNL